MPAVTRSPRDSRSTIDRSLDSIGRETCFIESSKVRRVTYLRRYATHYAIYCHSEKNTPVLVPDGARNVTILFSLVLLLQLSTKPCYRYA
jgi:hypothetical protein